MGSRLPDQAIAITSVTQRSVSTQLEPVLHPYGALVSDPTGYVNSKSSPNIKSNLPFPVTLSLVPTLTFSGGSPIQGYGPYRDYNRNHQIFDNMTKIWGNHTIRFGGVYYHYEKTENAATGNQGTFAFAPNSVPTRPITPG